MAQYAVLMYAKDSAHAPDATSEDAMEPGEDAATPGAPLAPGIPEHAEPVADLDQRLPPGTV